MPSAGLRVYFGTIPDYAASDTTGVRLAGVATGGPAESAGLRAGDVVVEVAGRRVDNLYDYTYLLEELEIGEAVEVIVLSDGRRRLHTVVPASRD